MWILVGMVIATALAGQDGPTETQPEPRYGQLRAAADAEQARRAGEPADDDADWGFDLYRAQPRLTLAQRIERDCADETRAADESETACRERVTEAVIQEALSRGDATRRTPDWTQAEEREWVERPARNPIDRLRDCRQSSQHSREGESSSWSIRCGDHDGPAAEALDRVLGRD